MRLREAIECVAQWRLEQAVIVGPGSASGLLYSMADRSATIYNMEMGYAAAMALGVALAVPEEAVLAIEGDGSMLAGLCVLSTISRYRPPNLIVLVLDNGVYGTVGDGSIETATSHGTDLAAVARACGWPSSGVVEIDTPDALRSSLELALGGAGPWMLHASIAAEARAADRPRPKPGRDIVETAVGFRREMIARGHGA